MISRELELVEVDAELAALRRMGSLRRQRSRSGDIFSFAYAPEWLRGPAAFSFDPDLALAEGSQYPVPGRASFGIFMDSSPDRWGPVLMQRRENVQARREGRRPAALTEWTSCWECTTKRAWVRCGLRRRAADRTWRATTNWPHRR